ncbi:MAG: family 10 glycosylhydrolase, partial [Tepidisphaeraceae bacterium]
MICAWICAWSGLALFAFGCAGKSARTAGAPSIFGDPALPEPEFRAIFVPTAYNLEWPSRPGLHRRVQTDEINAIVSRAKDLNCNVMILQVRAFGDRIYRKTNLKDPYYPEPWAEPLNNTHDPDTRTAPTYDPLSEWINACDEAGLELHAWVNPFRVNSLVKIKQNGADVYLPVIKYQKQLYLDPRSKAVQDYVKAVLADLLDNYDATYPAANAPVRMAITSAAMSDDGGIDGILYDHNLPP